MPRVIIRGERYDINKWTFLTIFITIFLFSFGGIILDFFASTSLGLMVWTFKDYSELPPTELEYFGPEQQIFGDDEDVKPFKIKIPESQLIILKEKLSNTRELNPPFMGVGFKYGCNSEYLKSFLEFWKTKYNWKNREDYLNSFPQFTTQIAGLNIHFIHSKPNKAKARGKEILPMLLIHGWPGSLRGLYNLIPLLTTPMESHNFVFEIIAPSVPGNGFSDAPQVPGLDAAKIAIIFDKLMLRLGFRKYFIHAADTGALIGQSQAILFPQRVLGYHSNMCISVSWYSIIYMYLAVRIPAVFQDHGKRGVIPKNFWILNAESGFFHFSARNPDTLGVMMSDSPAGLAANVLDKFTSWSNFNRRLSEDGGLRAFDKYDLLDIITIHWLTNSVTSSLRMWKETFRFYSFFMKNGIMMREVKVPSGCVWFKNEAAFMPLWVLKQVFPKLVSLNYLRDGGHFPALEKPLDLSDDIWEFVKIARFVAERDKRLKTEL
ncbi:unnamed protein product [Nezara viridula]|uniref:microsomal epoxide hydrolase n=1 Tax=Nezara viridula TaxID=85310 RepID=A0A9P0H7S1_NEZVI|nr:unnamed protein product [Nezara viridula]CAH1396978.1 unnamed protein product [Nezara viridula]